MNNRDVVIWLSKEERIGPVRISDAVREVGEPVNLLEISHEMRSLLLGKDVNLRFETDIRAFKADDYINSIKSKNIGLVTFYDDEYPERLREIPDIPYVLYFRGNVSLLKDENIIGVVGSRTPSAYGVEMCRYFSRELSDMGMSIASGMAIGIDSVAHHETFSVNGRTIAVLGSGINVCYPKRNYSLYEKLGKEMLIISEQPPDTEPFIYNFPLRNRIISGISKGVLVIEARKKSGSLITADMALSQNRYIYAVPGRIGDKLSEGTNNLISEGRATLVTSPDIIRFDMLGDVPERIKNDKVKINLSQLEKEVLKRLGQYPVFVSDIAEELDIRIGELVSILIKLEKNGIAKQVERGYYIRTDLHT